MDSRPDGPSVGVMAVPNPVPLVVWYDDDCGVCSASVRFLRSRADASVRFRPSRGLTDPDLVARADVALLVVGPRGLEEGAAAVAAVLDRSGAIGRLGSILLGLPVVDAVADRVYRVVAANRASISRRLGLASGCALPGPGAGRATPPDESNA